MRPFIVKSESALKALPYWLKENGCNCYSYSRANRFSVGYDTKPDSDWGGRYTFKGLVIVAKPSLFAATEAAIRAAYGWEPLA